MNNQRGFIPVSLCGAGSVCFALVASAWNHAVTLFAQGYQVLSRLLPAKRNSVIAGKQARQHIVRPPCYVNAELHTFGFSDFHVASCSKIGVRFPTTQPYFSKQVFSLSRVSGVNQALSKNGPLILLGKENA